MRYYKISQQSGNGIFSCIKKVGKHCDGIKGFVGCNKKDDLPFGYMRITHKNGLWLEVQRRLLEEVEEFDYETCPDYEKVI